MHRFLSYILYGAARSFDLFGTIRDPRVERIRKRSDAEALRSDWEAVGRDLQSAILRVRKERKHE